MQWKKHFGRWLLLPSVKFRCSESICWYYKKQLPFSDGRSDPGAADPPVGIISKEITFYFRWSERSRCYGSTCWHYILREHLPFPDDRSDPGADITFWHYFPREHLPFKMIGEIQVLRIHLLVLYLKGTWQWGGFSGVFAEIGSS